MHTEEPRDLDFTRETLDFRARKLELSKGRNSTIYPLLKSLFPLDLVNIIYLYWNVRDMINQYLQVLFSPDRHLWLCPEPQSFVLLTIQDAFVVTTKKKIRLLNNRAIQKNMTFDVEPIRIEVSLEESSVPISLFQPSTFSDSYQRIKITGYLEEPKKALFLFEPLVF